MKLLHLFFPSKTAPLVPEFAVEDLPLDRTAALGPEFAVKDMPLGRTMMMMIIRHKNRQNTAFKFDSSISFRDINFQFILIC